MIEFEMFVVLLNSLKRFLLTLTSWLQHIILSSKEDGFTTKLPPFILLLHTTYCALNKEEADHKQL